MRAFFDTNVLVYAVTSEPRKQRADQILRAGGSVSVQVLNEFANVAFKKLQHDWTKIAFALDRFRLSFDAVLPLTLDTHTAALTLARDNRLPLYDALIVASAIEAGCDTLFTEDMQDSRIISGLTIVNPFSESS